MLREGVAKQYGITLYKFYSEPEAAHIMGVDVSTLKRRRREGRINKRVSVMSVRKVRYLGIHIADLMLGLEPKYVEFSDDDE